MIAGRPLKYPNVEALQSAIDNYFANVPEGKPITITGLALALDTTRELLIDYGNRDEYSDAIKRAKLRCENYAEEQLFNGRNAAGPIFALKNYKWSDKTEVENSGSFNIQVATGIPRSPNDH